jgi:hypothetical protein
MNELPSVVSSRVRDSANPVHAKPCHASPSNGRSASLNLRIQLTVSTLLPRACPFSPSSKARHASTNGNTCETMGCSWPASINPAIWRSCSPLGSLVCWLIHRLD